MLGKAKGISFTAVYSPYDVTKEPNHEMIQITPSRHFPNETWKSTSMASILIRLHWNHPAQVPGTGLDTKKPWPRSMKAMKRTVCVGRSDRLHEAFFFLEIQLKKSSFGEITAENYPKGTSQSVDLNGFGELQERPFPA